MIEISNLGFSYGPKAVLKNISMKVSEGNIYGLLGENGVGKTTLLTLLCGLKKPQAGTILVDGRNPFDRQPSLLADQFYLPDEVSPVHAKAIDFAKEHGVFWPKFTTILAELEVESDQRMDAMSAGQLKKTWIAFALACNAKYYYLDEPTNGLDIPSKAQFRKAVTRYTAEDSTLIISTHQVRDLENIIDPIIILDNQAVLVNAPGQPGGARDRGDAGNLREAVLRLRHRDPARRPVPRADPRRLHPGVSQHHRRGKQGQRGGLLQYGPCPQGPPETDVQLCKITRP